MTDSRRTQPDPAVGALLRAARRRRGLGLKPMAARIGTSHSYLSMLERGLRSPSAAMAQLLVDALGLDGAEASRVLNAGVRGVGRDRDDLAADPWLAVLRGRP